MRLPRRGLLALLPPALAGCGGLTANGAAGDPDASGTATVGSTRTPTGPSVAPQSVSVGNTHATTEFFTVVVERAGETVFVENRELVPGERHTARDVLDSAGAYDVVVETADGDRAAYRWDVVAGLDGLAVTLADGIEFVRTVRCGPDCAPATSGEGGEIPLVGDGSARWYAPARVVLANPGAAREAALTVALDGRTLVDYRYRVPRETRVVVPLTYRSGTYRVRVETAAGRVADDWHVPEEPSRVVDLATLDVGCGPANTELRVENADDRAHVVHVRIERGDEGESRFVQRFRLDSGESRTVVPVAESGRYDVYLRVDEDEDEDEDEDGDGDGETAETWWSCPPHGPATVSVDATGTVTLRSADR